MKTLFNTIMVLCLSYTAQAQSVQWAFKVLEYSSEKSGKESSANQVLGNPNVYPESGTNYLAWQPGGKQEEFIKVGFVKPLKAKKIIIVETSEPDYVSHVYAYDASGNETLVRTQPAQKSTSKNKILEINTADLDFTIYAVKIVIEAPKKHKIGIDAIGIADSDDPVIIKKDENFKIKSSLVVTRLIPTVNSLYIELGPIMTPNGQTLYFSRRDDPANIGGKDDLEDIWYSKWDPATKTWQPATNIGAPLNNKYPNFINSISPDGNTVLLGNSYSPEGSYIDDGVSTSHKTNNGWSDPEQLIIEDDYNDNVNASFYMSNSQRILLMCVERNDTRGNLDIYVSFINDDNTWTKPLNIGNDVNTAGSEPYVYLASDDKTLYFASTGHNGYGGTDMYVTHRLDDTWQKWSAPDNLGPKVNSYADETYFTLSAAGDKAFFTSEGLTKGDQDMFSLTLPPILQPTPVALIKGRVLNSKTLLPIPNANIIFENLETGKQIGLAHSSPLTGNYEIVLPSGVKYGYLAAADGFISVGANFDLTEQSKYIEKTIDLYLTPVETGQKVVLNNIFFEFDKSDLKKESYPELNRLSKTMAKSSTMKIEIAGYTDNIGTYSYNDDLSQKRAEAVVIYILNQSKIDKSRIVLKHFGEKNPVADNKSKKGREQNRRVEFEIIVQ